MLVMSESIQGEASGAPASEERRDDNKLIAQRREKLAQLRTQGNAFPNDFRRDALAGDLLADYGDWAVEALEFR
jgi:lysyl-tRNA synthetase class 2